MAFNSELTCIYKYFHLQRALNSEAEKALPSKCHLYMKFSVKHSNIVNEIFPVT